METKFTPGPWVAAKYQGFGPRTTVRQGDEKAGMRIASTFETTSPQHIERNEANARLIAAAPDMFEVLDNIGGLSRALRVGGPDAMDLQELSDALQEAVDMANAMVAKVLGEQA